MDARELMIGDIVYNSYRNKYIRWDYIHMFYHERPIEGRDIEPVPLTREILELNGFKLRNRYQYDENDWVEKWIWNSDDLFEMFEVMHSDVDGFLWKGCDIKYIHELQHALRIAGLKELADNFKI